MIWPYRWFPNSAFRLARALGWTRKWLHSGRLRFWSGFIVLGAAAAWLRFQGVELGKPALPQTGPVVSWAEIAAVLIFLTQVFAIYLLLWLVWRAFFRRKPLEVATTVNLAGAQFAEAAGAFAPDLISRLKDLRNSFKADDRPVQSASVPAELPTLTLGPGGGSLSEVVGKDSALKLGWFEVPVRPLLEAVQKAIPSRRLSSSLVRLGDRLTALAEISGETGFWWRVEREIPATMSTEQRGRLFAEISDELAHRIFATLTFVGSRDWRAVKAFIEGLRAYNATTFTDVGKKLNLRKAENCFFQARECDKNFFRCSYNLGVAYRLGERPNLAHAAFEQAIKERPDDADAAYALAELYSNSENFREAFAWASRATALSKLDARAWNLLGFVRRRLEAKPNDEGAWRVSLPVRRRAFNLAWRDLCHAAARGESLDSTSKALALPAKNLAVAYANTKLSGRATRVLRRTLARCRQSDLYFELGKIHRYAHHPQLVRACFAFWHACGLAKNPSTQALMQAYLAETFGQRTGLLSGLSILDPAASFCRRGFDNAFRAATVAPSVLTKEAREQLTAACRALAQTRRPADAQKAAIEEYSSVGPIVRALPEKIDSSAIKTLRSDFAARFRKYRGTRKTSSDPTSAKEVGRATAWARAYCWTIVAERLLDDADGSNLQGLSVQLEELLRCSIRIFQKYYPADPFIARTHGALARLLKAQSNLHEAKRSYMNAVSVDPFSADAIFRLGQANKELGDMNSAEINFRRAYGLDPQRLDFIQELGYVSWGRGALLNDSLARYAEYKMVIAKFVEAIELSQEPLENAPYLGYLNFWLGRFYHELKEYDDAVKHYTVAKALNIYMTECSLLLGSIAIEQERYDSASEYLRDAAMEIRRLRKSTPGSPKAPPLQDWWRQAQLKTPQGKSQIQAFSEFGLTTPGYFMLKIRLWLALSALERGGDVPRARGILRRVERRKASLLAPSASPAPLASAAQTRKALRSFRSEIDACYLDYLGWAYFHDDQISLARQSLEAAVRARQDPESLYHLARLNADMSAHELAKSCCERARACDGRGVFTDRIAKIEAQLAGASSPR